LIGDRLKFGFAGLLAHAQIGHSLAQFVKRYQVLLVSRQEAFDALMDTKKITPKRLFSPLGRIGAPRGLQSAIEFDLNKLRVFQQSHDFDPDDFIEEVLTHRPVVADRAGKPPIFV
jgi:hypothetical protein